ncbi:MAG TPA: MBL fold metallo-hydrolase [Balneolaceae bacterium]|nr:MBL fold metallo-hydrolase [Balneolaceae bacterium]
MKSSTVHVLYEGTFSVGTDKTFKPIAKEDPPFKGSLKLSINPFLICEEDRNILFDSGIGNLLSDSTPADTMVENLARHDLTELDITDIFISHLHFDHFAGLAHRRNGYWELSFPNATVYVSKDGWENLLNSIDGEDDVKQSFVHFLDAKADFRFLEDSESPIPTVRTKIIGGHTQFHQVLFYENDDQKYIMAGDVIGRRIAVNRNFAAKFDYQPKVSMEWRSKLKDLAWKENYTFMAYHETDHPLFKLKEKQNKLSYSINNIV